MVSHSHAESLLARGKPEEAARIYALSNAEFDMVVLRLLGVLSPPTARSSIDESDSSNVSVSGLLHSDLRGSSTSTDTDTDTQCHSDAVSAALLQYLTDKLEHLFPSPTPSSEVTDLVATLSVCLSISLSICLSFYPSDNICYALEGEKRLHCRDKFECLLHRLCLISAVYYR